MKAILVIVELTSDNPIVNISRKVFGLAPRYFRNLFSLDADVINEAGEAALMTRFSTDSLKKYVREANLNIIREERHMLALFTLNALSCYHGFYRFFLMCLMNNA